MFFKFSNELYKSKEKGKKYDSLQVQRILTTKTNCHILFFSPIKEKSHLSNNVHFNTDESMIF